MTGGQRDLAAAAAVAMLAAAPAAAEVLPVSGSGFSTSHTAFIAAPREDVWRELVRPEYWWTQNLSGDPANVRLDLRAGGCLCEDIASPSGLGGGTAEHARVILIMPEETLRLAGALGALQSQALAGTLTITLMREGEGTRIGWDYVVGGAARFDLAAMSQEVDREQGELLRALVSQIEVLQAGRRAG